MTFPKNFTPILTTIITSLQLTEENVYEVMCAADMFLLPGLKRYCANAMAQFLTVGDVVTVLQTARLFNLPRLEDQCAEFMADNLEQVNIRYCVGTLIQTDILFYNTE